MPQKRSTGHSDNGRGDGEYAYPQSAPRSAITQFDWSNVDADVMADAIGRVTARGHAISFAVNRTGSTGCVTILAGNERPKYYCETLAEAEDLLTALAGGPPSK